MNRIFKVIFNQSTGVMEAVSELAKSQTKSSSVDKRTKNPVFKLTKLTIMMAALLGVSGEALAARGVAVGTDLQGQQAHWTNQGTAEAADDAVAVGASANAAQKGVAIGANATASGKTQSIAIGGGKKAGEGATASGDQAIAIGGNVVAEGDSSVAIGGDNTKNAAKKTVSYEKYDSDGETHHTENKTLGDLFVEITGIENVVGSVKYPKTHTKTGSVAVGVSTIADGRFSTAFGVGSKVEDDAHFGLALGTGANVSKLNAVAIGSGAQTDGQAKKYTQATVEILDNSGQATGRSITYKGFTGGAANLQPGDQVSFGKAGYERQLKNVAAGEISKTSTDAINGSQLFSMTSQLQQQTNTYFHVNDGGTEQQAGDPNTNLGSTNDKAGAIGKYSVTAGVNAKAPNQGNITIGHNATIMPGVTGGVAIGDNAQAKQGGGKDSFGTAFGANSVAYAQSTAIGSFTFADPNDNHGLTNIATAATAIGVGSEARGDGAIAIGGHAVANSGFNDIAIGRSAYTPGRYGMAMGMEAVVGGYHSIALGTDARAGYRIPSVTNGDSNISIGHNARTFNEHNIAMGDGALAGGFTDEDRTSKYGLDNYTRLTVATLEAKYNEVNTRYQAALAEYNANDGYKDLTKSKKMGELSKELDQARMDLKIAKDNQNYYLSDLNPERAGGGKITNAVVIGDGSKALNSKAIIFGAGTTVKSENSGAFGHSSEHSFTADNSYSVGNENTVSKADAFVLGNSVTADVANSVYLGIDSQATAGSAVGTAVKDKDGADGATTTAGDTGTVENATIGNISYENFAGGTGHGVITLGASGTERRIQNLAAGEISATSTDAINGSQLYAVAEKLGNGLTFNGETGTTNKTLGESLNIESGDLTNSDFVGANLKTEVKDGKLLIGMNKKPIFDEVHVGNVEINAQGIDAGDKVIKHVGNPTIASDAANKGYVDALASHTIKLQGDSGLTDTQSLSNPEISFAIKGESGGEIETEASGREVVVKLTQATKDKLASIDDKANKDLDNITPAGKTVIQGLFAVEDGAHTTASSRDVNGVKTFKVDVKTDGEVADNNTGIVTGDTVFDALAPIKENVATNTTNITALQANTFKLGGDSASETEGQRLDKENGLKFNIIGDDDVKTKASTNQVQISLTDKTKASLAKADSAMQSFTTAVGGQTAQTLDQNNKQANFIAGDNIELTGNTGGITIATSENPTFKNVEADKVTLGNVVIDKTDGINAGDKQVKNVASGGDISEPTNAKNAANIGDLKKVLDVANAGWDIGENSKAKVGDVNTGKQVNFINGNATTATVTAEDDHFNVKYDVNVDNNTLEIDDTTHKVKAKTTSISTNNNGTVTAGDENALATAKTVADAINASSFTVESGTDGGAFAANNATGTQAIKAGDNVKLQAGKNLTVKRVGKDFTFATADDVTFTKTTVGNVITENNKITGLDKGTKDADAVNFKQLKDNAEKVAESLGGGSTVFEDGSFSAPTYTLTNPTDGTTTAFHNVGDAISNLNTSVNKPLTFIGDEGTTEQKLGSTFAINTGDAKDGFVGTNLYTKVENGKVIIGMSENPTFKDVKADKVTVGPVVIDNAKGINAGNQKIANVESGVPQGTSLANVTGDDLKNAVNVGDLQKAAAAATTTVGTTTPDQVTIETVNNDDGSKKYNVNVQTASITANKTDGTIANVPDTDENKVATVGNVANAIKNAGWKLQEKGADKDLVQAGDIVNFTDGSGTVVSIDTKNNITTVKYNVKQTTLTAGTNGTITAGAQDESFATAKNVADAINESSFTMESGIENGGTLAQGNATGTEKIKAGDNVKLQAGKNLTVKRDGKNFTYATANKVSFDKVSVGDVVLDQTDGINAGNKQITGVASAGDITQADNANKAVNAGDLNTAINGISWNIQGENGLTDATKVGDKTVKFINGEGTSVNVENATASEPFKVKVDVNQTTLTTTNDGTVTAGNNAGTSFVTAENMATALNALAWKTESGKAEGGKLGSDNTVGVEKVEAGTTVRFKAGKNLTVSRSAKDNKALDYVYQLQDDLTDINSIAMKAGGNGINMNDSKITNLSAGTISDDSKDAINGGQIKDIADAYKTILGGNATVQPDGSITMSNIGGTGENNINDAIKHVNAGFNIAANADQTGLATDAKTIKPKETLSIKGKSTNSDWSQFDEGQNIMTQVSGDGTITVALKKELAVDKVTAGTGASNVEIGNDGVKVGGKTYINKDGINANDKQITGVASGLPENTTIANAPTNSLTNAANIGDLKKAAAAATSKVATETPNQVTINPVTSTTDGSTTYNVNVQTAKITTNPNGSVVDVPDTDVNKVATVGNVANAIKNAGWMAVAAAGQGGALVGAANPEKVSAGETVTFEAGKNMTVAQNGKKFTYATADEVSFDKTTVGNVVTENNKITGLDAGTEDKDAVNFKQLKDSAEKVAEVLGGNAGVDPNTGTVTKPTYTLTSGNPSDGDTSNYDNVGDALTGLNKAVIKPLTFAGDEGSTTQKLGSTFTIETGTSQDGFVGTNLHTKVEDGKVTIGMSENPTFKQVTADKVTLGDVVIDKTTGINAGNKQITGVTSGLPTGTELANAEGNTLTNAANIGDLQQVANATTTKGLNFAGDNDGVTAIHKDLGEKLEILGGADQTKLTENNIGVINAGGKLHVKLAKELQGLNSVQVTDGKADGKTVNITPEGITGLTNNLPVTDNTSTVQEMPKGNDLPSNDRAATVGDILNAGWNLQTNNQAKDFVKAYDTVNFIGEDGVTVEYKADSTHTQNNIVIKVDAQDLAESAQLPVVYTKPNGDKVYKQADGSFNTKPDGSGESVPAADVVASMQNWCRCDNYTYRIK